MEEILMIYQTLYKRKSVSSTSKKLGFTIVELLIVIVVIGILAAITIVSYSGMQSRAQDSKRVDDARAIVSALELYKTLVGSYPSPASNDPSGWEVSKNTPATFVNVLKSSGTLSILTPVDPINSGSYFYKYYKYPSGNAGCDSARGDYYVFVIQILSSKSGNGQGPGFSCTGRDWGVEGSWVTGGYTN